MLNAGMSKRRIAAALGCHVSTILRLNQRLLQTGSGQEQDAPKLQHLHKTHKCKLPTVRTDSLKLQPPPGILLGLMGESHKHIKHSNALEICDSIFCDILSETRRHEQRRL